MFAQLDEERAAYRAALLRERKHYEIHGLLDRIEDVDAELDRLDPPAQVKRGRPGKAPAKSAGGTET